MFVWYCEAYRNNQCISIRPICGYEESLLMSNAFSRVYKVGSSHSLACHSERFRSVCERRLTANKLTLPLMERWPPPRFVHQRRNVIFKAWETYWQRRERKLCWIIGVMPIETFRRIFLGDLHAMHALHLVIWVFVFSSYVMYEHTLNEHNTFLTHFPPYQYLFNHQHYNWLFAKLCPLSYRC